MLCSRIDHYGIVVRDIKKHIERNLTHIFPQDAIGPIISDPLQKANVCFIYAENGCIELVEPHGKDSPIYEFIEKKPAGYHHICIEVEDLDKALETCSENGQITVSEPKPAVAFDNRRIAFVVGADRLLWELLEAKKN